MIQFLRGDANSVNSSVVVPADGQPVFNKTDKLLYIGDGATQLKNLEPIAGLNALIYNTVYETSNTSVPSSINATPQSFNRTPVLGDLALFIVSLHGFNSTYLCIYTVSNVSDTSVTCTLKSSVSITGSQGEDGEDGADGKGILKSVKPCLLPNTWSKKTWNGLKNFFGSNIWTDGENIYYAGGGTHYVLDRETSTWTKKTWNGMGNFVASDIWTDGENIYCSDYNNNYVLNKDTSTWSTKTWNGLTSFNGSNIWTDGENIYCSDSTRGIQSVLNKSTSTWSAKTWNGLTSFSGSYIWTDGKNIYYSDDSSNHYVLNKDTSTWSAKTWNGYTNISGNCIWTDGENIYYSYSGAQKILDKETSTWLSHPWDDYFTPNRSYIWTDGENIYWSNGSSHRVLNKDTSVTPLVGGNYGSGLYRHQISFFGNTPDSTVSGCFDVYDSNPDPYTMSTFYAKYSGKVFPVYPDYQNVEGDPGYLFSTAFYMSSSSHFSVYYPSTISTDGSCFMSIATTNETESITDTVYRIL